MGSAAATDRVLTRKARRPVRKRHRVAFMSNSGWGKPFGVSRNDPRGRPAMFRPRGSGRSWLELDKANRLGAFLADFRLRIVVLNVGQGLHGVLGIRPDLAPGFCRPLPHL